MHACEQKVGIQKCVDDQLIVTAAAVSDAASLKMLSFVAENTRATVLPAGQWGCLILSSVDYLNGGPEVQFQKNFKPPI